MIRFVFSGILLMILSFTGLNAQNSGLIAENALGLRLGGGDGFGAEISYQRQIGSPNNRLEADLGWRNDSYFDAFKLTGLYQWVWNIEGGFNWYAGVGGGLGSVEDNRYFKNGYRPNDGMFLFVAGDIGIEYNFDIPLMLSLDFRPEIGFSDYDVLDNFIPDIALGIRYQF